VKLCDKNVSQIGFGTWKMGGGFWTPDYSRDSHYVEILKYVINNGINLIDTAEMYGGGHAEELVGKAIKGFDRENIFIITKVWPNHLRYEDVIKSAKESLRRLDTKYIDLYLIHWPNPSIPLNETISAMENLVDQGIVRCIGVSNFDVKLLSEAITLTRKYEIVANEMEYSVNNKSAESDIIPFCEKNNIKVIAYSPLARGNVKNNKILEEIGRKYGKTAIQVALNYLIKRSIPIPKASTKDHVDEILGSLGWSLSDEDYERIRKL
jgi:diketogulonate reductase-like aldo/keto reductase